MTFVASLHAAFSFPWQLYGQRPYRADLVGGGRGQGYKDGVHRLVVRPAHHHSTRGVGPLHLHGACDR